MTLQLSQGEILQTSQKASRAAGLPHGLDLDAAANATWLEACGLDGLEILAAEIAGQERFRVGSISCCRVGPSLLELGSDCSSGVVLAPPAVDLVLLGREVTVPTCRALPFFVAEAARRAPAGRPVEVAWTSPAGACRVVCAGNAVNRRPGPGSRLTASVRLRLAEPAETPGNAPLRPRSGSLTVDPLIWNRIAGVADRNLVVASQRSRSGAGAEVDDSA